MPFQPGIPTLAALILASSTLFGSTQCLAALTVTEINTLLAAHNQVRASAVPTGANMTRLVWDDALASVAQSWTNQCNWSHNGGRNAAYAALSTNTGGVGENIYITTGPRAGAIAGPSSATALWAGEAADYNFSTNTCASGKVCGHFTQMVWANTLRVGCAITQCASVIGLPGFFNAQFITCDYNPAGNFIGQPPYVAGQAGSLCPPALPVVDGGLCSPAVTPPTTPVPLLPTLAIAALGCSLFCIARRAMVRN